MRQRISLRYRFFISTAFALLLFCSYLLAHTQNIQPKHFTLYANKGGDDLRKLYLNSILSAKKSITLIIYSLRDPYIVGALNRQAENGVIVRLFIDEAASPTIEERLASSIQLKGHSGPGLMHLKILAVDERLLLIGSANMTPDSLRLHDNLVLAVEDPEIASIAREIFEGTAPAKINKGPLTIYLFPEQKFGERIICDLLATAKKTIDIAMYTFTNKTIAVELVAAKKRDVEVRVAVDRNTSQGAGNYLLRYLMQENVLCKVHAGPHLLHHKCALIDKSTLLMGSANWTKAAFNKNRDALVILAPLTSQQRHKAEKAFDFL